MIDIKMNLIQLTEVLAKFVYFNLAISGPSTEQPKTPQNEKLKWRS